MNETCPFCGEPIYTYRYSYQRVQGWTRKRNAGGANQITLPVLVNEWAHGLCIDRAKRDIHLIPGQLNLE